MSTREDWQRRLGPLYGGAVALVSSTPWRWPGEVSDDARSPGWIVVVAIPIGLLAWLTAALVRGCGFSQPIAALFGLAMLTVASAALIERGVAERVDQWVGQRASIAGILVIVFATLLRAAAVLSLRYDTWLWLFVTAAVVGRWSAVLLQALGDPIHHDEARRSLVARPAPAWLTAAISGGVLTLAVLAVGKAGIVAVALAALAAFVLGLEAQRRDGGLSPPVVALAAGIGELTFLLIATL